MIIKAFADCHNDQNQLRDTECDILICAGDANIKGNYTEGEAFLWWFVKQPAKYKILVPGNHDHKLRTHPDLIKLAIDLGIYVLNDDYLEINGIKMYGVSQCFWSEEAGLMNLKERQAAWRDIPKGLDILITHIPPKHIMDANRHGLPCGCSQLTEKVKEVKPRFHVFGHIHEFGGKTQKVWDTTFINCAVKNEYYITVGDTMEIPI